MTYHELSQELNLADFDVTPKARRHPAPLRSLTMRQFTGRVVAVVTVGVAIQCLVKLVVTLAV